MAEVNYINPSALMPQTGFKPDGFLGGYMWGEQRDRFREMMGLQKLMSELGLKTAQEEYSQGMPVRAAQRAENVVKSNTNVQMFPRSEAARVGTAELGLDTARQTQSSDVARKIAENISSKGKAGLEQWHTGLKFAMMAGQMIQNGGPTAGTAVIEQAQAMGLPPQMAQLVLQDPGKTFKLLQEVNETLQGDLVKQREKDVEAFKRQKYASDTSLTGTKYTADAAYNRAIESAKLKGELGGGSDKLWGKILERIRTARSEGREPDPADLEMAQFLSDTKGAMGQNTELLRQQLMEAVTKGKLPAQGRVPAPTVPGTKESKKEYKPGDVVKEGNEELTIISPNSNGTYRVRNKQGRTGIWRP